MNDPWEQAEVEVCTDCELALANGLPDDLGPDRAAAITGGIAGWAAEGWRLEPGGGEAGFSWARCEVCGDGRGGDRAQAWALRPPPRQEGPAVRRTPIGRTTGSDHLPAGGAVQADPHHPYVPGGPRTAAPAAPAPARTLGASRGPGL